MAGAKKRNWWLCFISICRNCDQSHFVNITPICLKLNDRSVLLGWLTNFNWIVFLFYSFSTCQQCGGYHEFMNGLLDRDMKQPLLILMIQKSQNKGWLSWSNSKLNEVFDCNKMPKDFLMLLHWTAIYDQNNTTCQSL